MSQRRGGRPPTHGVRRDAADLGVIETRPQGRRPSPHVHRTKRAVKRIEKKLKTAPLATVREGIRRTTAAETVIEQRAHDYLLSILPEAAHPPQEPVPMELLLGLTKFVHWIGARLDRNRDQLVELEMMERKQNGPDLQTYLAQRAAAQPGAAPAVDVGASAVPADAADAPTVVESEDPA